MAIWGGSGQGVGAHVGRRASTAAALLLIGSLVACSHQGDEVVDSEVEMTTEPPMESASGSTSTTLNGDDEVLRDYEAAGEMLSAAYNPPDPEHPGLLAHFAGESLATRQENLREYQRQGVALVEISTEQDPEVTRRDGDEATVEDCIVEEFEYVDAETGEVRDTERTEGHVVWTLRRSEDGIWQIMDSDWADGEC